MQFAACIKDDNDDDDDDDDDADDEEISFTDFRASHAHLPAFENVINTNWNGSSLSAEVSLSPRDIFLRYKLIS